MHLLQLDRKRVTTVTVAANLQGSLDHPHDDRLSWVAPREISVRPVQSFCPPLRQSVRVQHATVLRGASVTISKSPHPSHRATRWCVAASQRDRGIQRVRRRSVDGVGLLNDFREAVRSHVKGPCRNVSPRKLFASKRDKNGTHLKCARVTCAAPTGIAKDVGSWDIRVCPGPTPCWMTSLSVSLTSAPVSAS